MMPDLATIARLQANLIAEEIGKVRVRDEQIRVLREALERIANECATPSGYGMPSPGKHVVIARDVLASAATPSPDPSKR
jgi:hypothetical protein